MWLMLFALLAMAQIAVAAEAGLDLALVPDAEKILYCDKAFTQSIFIKTARTLMLERLKKKVSATEYQRTYGYLKAFSEYNCLYSVNLSKAIDSAGKRLSFEKIDWMLGWEAAVPVPFWDDENNAGLEINSVEIVRCLQGLLASQLSDEKLNLNLKIWEIKASNTIANAPGWRLLPISITSNVTTKYELLWAISQDRKLFFFGPSETVMRQLSNGNPPAPQLKASFEQLRDQVNGKSCLALRIFVNEEAVSKIDSLLLDFRRTADMALQQYLIRITHCSAMLEANEDLRGNMEIQFMDSIAAQDFYSLLREKTLKTAISYFSKKENIENISAIKNTKIGKQGSTMVTMETLVTKKELIDAMSKEETQGHDRFLSADECPQKSKKVKSKKVKKTKRTKR